MLHASRLQSATKVSFVARISACLNVCASVCVCVCIIVGGHKPSSTRYPTLFLHLASPLPSLPIKNVPTSQRGQTRPIWIRSGAFPHTDTRTHIHRYISTHTHTVLLLWQTTLKQWKTHTHTTELTNYKKQEEKQSGEREKAKASVLFAGKREEGRGVVGEGSRENCETFWNVTTPWKLPTDCGNQFVAGAAQFQLSVSVFHPQKCGGVSGLHSREGEGKGRGSGWRIWQWKATVNSLSEQAKTKREVKIALGQDMQLATRHAIVEHLSSRRQRRRQRRRLWWRQRRILEPGLDKLGAWQNNSRHANHERSLTQIHAQHFIILRREKDCRGKQKQNAPFSVKISECVWGGRGRGNPLECQRKLLRTMRKYAAPSKWTCETLNNSSKFELE